MIGSKLVSYRHESPNYNTVKNRKIDRIVIHHTAGAISLETLGNIFSRPSRQASSQYGVDNQGKIGQFVSEDVRAWTTGSYVIDDRAITIEVCNSKNGQPWPVSDKALESTIKLCADICQRYGFELTYTGDKTGSLHMHKWYQNTECPGEYLGSKFSYIVQEVNKILHPPKTDLYRVQTGAFKHKQNALALEKKVKSAGFDTYMVEEGGLYKVQVGAYAKEDNAKKMATQLRNKGFSTYITTKSGSPVDSTKDYLQLSEKVNSWPVYALNKVRTQANVVGILNPRLYNGLEYEILEYKENKNVAIIQTSMFGKAQIWIGAENKNLYKIVRK